MRTLIELYDERPMENTLSVETFCPERVVYLAPGDVVRNKAVKLSLERYFRHRGLEVEVLFRECSLYDAGKIERLLHRCVEEFEDCALDITGGTETALFAGGMFCRTCNVPVFTYSRKRNRFFNISNAPFADDLPCRIRYNVEDFFLMAGGAMRGGRVDNALLHRYDSVIDPFFDLYLTYRREWTALIGYLQRISQLPREAPITLRVEGDYTVKGERGSRISANEPALRDLEKIGFLHELRIVSGERVSFTFADEQIRTWLRDVGSVLELYVYKSCKDTGLFQDVRTSAVVDWEAELRQDSVTNELDVVAARGVVPLFISCKTCSVSTEALNELAILRDRFGGQMAHAAIVTAEHCNRRAHLRATELGIHVIDLPDLRSGAIAKRLKALTLEK